MSIRRSILAGLAVVGLSGGGLATLAPPSLASLSYLPAPSSVFGSPGAGNGQFSKPAGIAIDAATDALYIVDKGNNRVQKFDAEGKYLGQLDGSKTPAGSFSGPYSVAVDNSKGPAKGDVYVTDNGHDVVDVFDSAGKYLSQLADAAENLSNVAVDSVGNVWVLYRGKGLRPISGEVHEFSDTGTFMGSFNFGCCANFEPDGSGIAVDSNGAVYVVRGVGNVSKFTGSFATKWTNIAELGKGTAIGVALNPATSNVFLDTQSASPDIEELGPFGEPFGEVISRFATEGLANSAGIAVDGSDGTVYASQERADNVAIFKLVLLADLITGEASGVGQIGATLVGTVKRNGIPVSYSFQYGETAAYGSSTPPADAASEEETVSANLTELESGTTYHYRLVAKNENGASYGADQTFTTLPAVPAVNDSPPTVTSTRTTALLTATLKTAHSATACHVEYVDASEYQAAAANPYSSGASSQIAQLEAGHGEKLAILPLTGLTPDTTYHYRVVASNATGSTFGPDYTFTTAPATPPAVTTGAGGEVTQTSVTLTGIVEPRGLQTSYEFELGTDTTYGGAKLFGSAGQSAGAEPVFTTVQYLIPGTVYHYRLVATNEDGTTYGQDMTFATPGVPSPIVQPPATALIPSPTVQFPSVAGAITKPQGAGKKAKQKRRRRSRRTRRAGRRRAKGGSGRR